MKALEVTKDVYWVGARDYDLEVFDVVMKTDEGTTYSSYVIKGTEKTALVEACKMDKYEEYLERVQSVVDIKDIDYVIINHTEPDHSGCLHELLRINPNIKVFATRVGMRYLREIVNEDFEGIEVEKQPSLELGGYTLDFIPAPFLHWPDSMLTYCKELKLLFSCDMFGCHFCSEEIFNDLITEDFMKQYKYYFDCIFSPYSKFVLQCLDKLENLDIEILANAHGPVIRKDADKYMELYREWSAPKSFSEPTVIIPYVTSYSYTRVMAEEIAKGIESTGVKAILKDMVFEDKDEVMELINLADGILFGSCTIMGDALPPIYELLYEMNPTVHKGKYAGAFGSYGWTGEAVPNMEARIGQLRLKKPLEGLRILFRPREEDIKNCYEYGVDFGNAVLGKKK